MSTCGRAPNYDNDDNSVMTANNDLSERELEILRLVATGASNKEIAQHLHISTNTVKVHLRNIYAKAGVASRTEAAMYAVQSGLVITEGRADAQGSLREAVGDGGSREAERLAGRKWIGWQAILSWLALGVLIVLAVIGVSAVTSRQPEGAALEAVPQLRELPRWQTKAELPTARFNLAIAGYENDIYVFGGETAQNVTAAVDHYDSESDQWEARTPKPVPVAEAQAAVIGGKIYIPGGRMSSGERTDVLEIYQPDGDLWTRGASLPQPLSAYALVAYEGQLYVFGGWDGAGYHSDFHANPAGFCRRRSRQSKDLSSGRV